MGKIPDKIIPKVYEYAKLFYEGKISLTDAKKEINAKLKMNKSSAGDFVMNLRYMLNGEKYSRTLNKYSTDYYLSQIYKDFGYKGLDNALSSLAAHISYYENINNTKMPSQRLLFDKYSKFGSSEIDTRQQEELIHHFRKSKKSRSDLIKELKDFSSKESEVEKKEYGGYKRDNRIISKLKIIRDHKCQICKKQIRKADGTFYTEAAHIKPKYEQGSEDPTNLLILCPNHHKEFDYGERKILNHSNSYLEMELNGKYYKINLEIV